MPEITVPGKGQSRFYSVDDRLFERFSSIAGPPDQEFDRGAIRPLIESCDGDIDALTELFMYLLLWRHVPPKDATPVSALCCYNQRYFVEIARSARMIRPAA